jgi:hypothetical protein
MHSTNRPTMPRPFQPVEQAHKAIGPGLWAEPTSRSPWCSHSDDVIEAENPARLHGEAYVSTLCSSCCISANTLHRRRHVWHCYRFGITSLAPNCECGTRVSSDVIIIIARRVPQRVEPRDSHASATHRRTFHRFAMHRANGRVSI